jgi:hypothetical protein
MVRIEMARSGWFEMTVTGGFCLCKIRKESRSFDVAPQDKLRLTYAVLLSPDSNPQSSVGFAFDLYGEVGQILRQPSASAPAFAGSSKVVNLASNSETTTEVRAVRPGAWVHGCIFILQAYSQV